MVTLALEPFLFTFKALFKICTLLSCEFFLTEVVDSTVMRIRTKKADMAGNIFLDDKKKDNDEKILAFG